MEHANGSPEAERSRPSRSTSLPTLELDLAIDTFVRRHNRRQVFARLFGSVDGSERLGRYRLLRHIGQGGMGVVYAAHDEILDRTVAIKLVRTGVGRQRLLREGQAMARLAHPNVVRVYEVGEARPPRSFEPGAEGQTESDHIAYIAMELVDGQTLASWLREPRARARILESFVAAGRGLEAAHAVGLVHRDFKPHNVMVHRDGRVMVTDFGLARRGGPPPHDDTVGVFPSMGDGSLDLLTTGGPGGTPAYMAPEALIGGEISPRSDQFSFCVALWEALYGARPFGGADLDELVESLHHQQPRRAASGRQAPRRVHEALVRGLAVDPDARWPDMDALLAELERALAPQRLRPWIGLGLLVMVAVMAVLSIELRDREQALADKDEDLAHELEASRRALAQLEEALSVQRGLRAVQLIDEDREVEALSLGILAVGSYAPSWDPAPPPEGVDGLAAVLANDAQLPRAIADQNIPPGAVAQISVDPSGEQVAIANGRLFVWRLEDDSVRELEHPRAVHAVDISPDGNRLVSGSRSETARIWDLGSGALVHELVGHHHEVHVVRFSPSGARVATASIDHDLRLWDANSGALLATGRGHDDVVKGLVFAPRGELLASYGYDHRVIVWSSDGEELVRMDGHEDVVMDAAFTPDGEALVTIGLDGSARLWNVRTGELERILERRATALFNMALSPDGREVVTGGKDGELHILDLASGRERIRMQHIGSVGRTFYGPEGAWLAVASAGDAVRVWDPSTGRLVARIDEVRFGGIASSTNGRLISADSAGRAFAWDLGEVTSEVRRVPGHRAHIADVAFSPAGDRIWTAGHDGQAKEWSAETGALLATLDCSDQSLFDLAISPAGTVLAIGGEDHGIRLWDTQTHELRHTLEGHHNYVLSLAFAPDGRMLASGSLDATVRLWDLDTGSGVILPGRQRDGARHVAFSIDGSRLASADGSGSLSLWSVEDGTVLEACPRHEGAIMALAFSPDGRVLATADDDRVVLGPAERCAGGHLLEVSTGAHRLAFSPDGRMLVTGDRQGTLISWDVASGARLRTFAGHAEPISDLAFGLDGVLLASASLGPEVRLWDVARGELVTELDGHANVVRRLAFSPDGRRLVATASADSSARLWDVERAELLHTLGDRLVVERDARPPAWPIPPALLLEIACERLTSPKAQPESIAICNAHRKKGDTVRFPH